MDIESFIIYSKQNHPYYNMYKYRVTTCTLYMEPF